MRKSFQVMQLFAAGLLIVALTLGCAPAATEVAPTAPPATSPPAAEEPTQPPPAAEEPSAFRVALVLPGSISDKGFNQSAYEGLLMIESELGAETAFSENTPVADFQQVYRGYGDQGYDVIIGHGFEFGEVALEIAPEYPDIYFVVTNNPEAAAANVSSVQPNSKDAAYLAGYLAGLMTESNKLGAVAGFDFPVIVAQMEAFKLGALAANPEVEVTIVYIGTFEDVAKAKEAALAQISAGADIVYHIADAAGVGVIQAAQEQGVYAIGWGLDQNSIAPETVITSEIVDTARMMYLEVKDIQEGMFDGTVRFFGLDTGVTGLSDYHGLVPDDVAQQVAAVQEQILSGALEVPFIPVPTE
jgi:basic membrane protein A